MSPIKRWALTRSPGLGPLLLIAAALLGCSSSEQPDGRADLERLRALPYIDFAGSEGDDGQDGVVRADTEKTSPGYTLYTSRKLCMAELLDDAGIVVNTWRHTPCQYWGNATLLPGGELLAVGTDPVPEDDRPNRLDYNYLLHLAWDGTVLLKARVPAHHDAQIAPDGNFLVITAKHRSEPRFDEELGLRDNYLLLLSPTGETIDEVSFYELLAPGPAGFRLERDDAPKDKEGVVDLFHANTISWMPHPHLVERGGIYGPDHVMVTFRNQDSVVIVDWLAKTVVWSWGRGELLGPHDATWLANGNILIFDNGLGRSFSRVIELDPIAKEIVWEFRAPDPETFYTASRGGSQRLPNGNTLITESDDGHGFEVTADGEIVWEFWNPNRNEKGKRSTIFRMRRYEPSFVAPVLGNDSPS